MLSSTMFLPFSFFPSLTLCYSLTHTLSLSLSPTQSLFLFHSPLLSSHLCLSLSLFLTRIHTYNLTHTNTLLYSPSLPFFPSYRNIAAGEALSYDYQFDTNEEDIFKCYCQAYNCRGTMAPRKKMNKVIVV